MSILYPVSGGFYTLAVRFLDPSYAFAMGWNYVFQWAVVLPLEITVAGTTVQYWGTDIMPLAAWITIFWVVISKYGLEKSQREPFLTFLQSLSAYLVPWALPRRSFGLLASSSWLSSCSSLSGCESLAYSFMLHSSDLLISVCICGGGPSGHAYDHYIGGSKWQDPGPFANGFKGVCSVFVVAAFAFGE